MMKFERVYFEFRSSILSFSQTSFRFQVQPITLHSRIVCISAFPDRYLKAEFSKKLNFSFSEKAEKRTTFAMPLNWYFRNAAEKCYQRKFRLYISTDRRKEKLNFPKKLNSSFRNKDGLIQYARKRSSR